MAVTLVRRNSNLQCLSTDTKPTSGVNIGDEIFETNTGATWRFDGAAWKKVTSAAVDKTTYARTTIDYEHHEAHSGSHYFAVGVIDIPGANDVLDMTWQMPGNTKWSHWIWSIYTEKALQWYVYEDATATNPLANTMTLFNSNRNSTGVSGTTLKYEIQVDLAAANVDTSVASTDGAVLLKSGKLGDNKGGGGATRAHELIMKQGSLYCLRAAASAAGYLNFEMQWYEHQNKE